MDPAFGPKGTVVGWGVVWKRRPGRGWRIADGGKTGGWRFCGMLWSGFRWEPLCGTGRALAVRTCGGGLAHMGARRYGGHTGGRPSSDVRRGLCSYVSRAICTARRAPACSSGLWYGPVWP